MLYDIGDQAFQPPHSIGYAGKSEVNGKVFYPHNLGEGKHPVIMIEHGMWDTCADRTAWDRLKAAQATLQKAEEAGDTAGAAEQEGIISAAAKSLQQWPCTPGTDQIPSYRGYDYLARSLASKGFVVVSIGANGINATSAGQAPTVYYARAALINYQLSLWQRLSTTGTGPLAGQFTDPETGKRKSVDFRGHLNMRDVGTVGHSMGGGGAMQQIANQRHGEWPAGVSVKASFALAPTDNWNGESVTEVPFAVMWGTCDQVNTGSYFESNRGANLKPIYKYTLMGGNHDYYNTQWSPSSNQVSAENDAVPGSRQGTCKAQFPDGEPDTQPDQVQLTEKVQRRLTIDYAGAFFQRYLQNVTAYDSYLTGKSKFPGVPDVVDAAYASPTRSASRH